MLSRRDPMLNSGRGATLVKPRETRSVLSLVTSQSMPSLPGKKSLLIFVVIGMCLVLLHQRHWLLEQVDHEINAIEVQGAAINFSLDQLQNRLQRVLGESFLFVDLAEVKGLVEQEPWVYQSAVSRVWPGRLVITVQEQQPLAVWNQNSFINTQGEVFTPAVMSAIEGLPVLVGPEGSQSPVTLAMVAMYDSIGSELSKVGLVLSELIQGPRGAWEMSLNNGLHVLLGRQDLQARLHRFLRVYETQLKQNIAQVQRVDARYPNGLAVAWKQTENTMEIAKQ